VVTNAESEETPTKQEKAEGFARNAIAGHPQGAVRRIILYCALFVFLGIGVWLTPFLVVSLASGVLLLATDSLL
jgi:hypothetical protein